MIKQENDTKFDDADSIPYAFPRRDSDTEIDGKKHKEPKLQTAVEIEKEAKTDEEKFIKTELEINKVEASNNAEIKEVKEEKLTQNFFIDNNDIFNYNEISENDRQFIKDLIDRTSFTADADKFVEDVEATKMEVFDPVAKRKMERQEQKSADAQSKNDQVAVEKNLMKKVRVKSEFKKESEKLRQQTEKNYIARIKNKDG